MSPIFEFVMFVIVLIGLGSLGERLLVIEEKLNQVLSLTRPPEQRNGADLAQQTCPSCHGEKRLLTGLNQFIECPTCKGTGHV